MSFQEFRALDNDLRDFALNEIISLRLANQINELYELSETALAKKLEELQPNLWPKETIFQKHFLTTEGIILFLGGFISKENLDAIWQRRQQLKNESKNTISILIMNFWRYPDLILNVLCTASGIKALKSGNCKIDELLKLKFWQLRTLASAEALEALEDGYLTTALVSAFKSKQEFSNFLNSRTEAIETTIPQL